MIFLFKKSTLQNVCNCIDKDMSKELNLKLLKNKFCVLSTEPSVIDNGLTYCHYASRMISCKLHSTLMLCNNDREIPVMQNHPGVNSF